MIQRLNQIASGYLPAVHLLNTQESETDRQLPYFEGTDRHQEAVRVLFTPSSPGRNIELEQDRWYTFENLVRIPDLRAGRPPCPTCTTELMPEDDTLSNAVELLTGVSATPAFVGTESVSIEPLGDKQWTLPIDASAITPIEWVCPGCGSQNTSPIHEVPASDNSQQLASRLVTAFKETETFQSSRAGESYDTYRKSYREIIKQGGVPNEDQLGYETLLSEFDFGTGALDPTRLDSLSVSQQVCTTTNPLTKENERLCNFIFHTREFDWARNRPALNLVLAIDISGSMALPFGMNRQESSPRDDFNPHSSKLAKIATVTSGLVQRLNEHDTLGVVLFNTDAEVLKPSQPVFIDTHRNLSSHLENITPQGNTNIMTGIRCAGELIQRGSLSQGPETENRILLFTDTMPATTAAAAEQIREHCNALATSDIGTTFSILDQARTEAARHLCRAPGVNVTFAPDTVSLSHTFRRSADSLLFPVAHDLTIESPQDPDGLELMTQSDPAATTALFHRASVFPSGPTLQSTPNALLACTENTDSPEFRIGWTGRDGTQHSDTFILPTEPANGETLSSGEFPLAITLYYYHQLLRRWCRNMHRRTVHSNSDRDRTLAEPSSDIDFHAAFENIRDRLSTWTSGRYASQVQREIDVIDVLTSSSA